MNDHGESPIKKRGSSIKKQGVAGLGRRTGGACLYLGGLLTLLLGGCGGGGASYPSLPPAPTDLAPGAVLGKAVFPQGSGPAGGQGQTVDGLPCNDGSEVYHIHVHLALIVNGEQIAIPAGIGIVAPKIQQDGLVGDGMCTYSLHTHDASGIIHAEAPAPAVFTLGQFFAVWGQPLSATGVAGFAGPVTAYVGGVPYTGAPGTLALAAHQQITLEVGTPLVPPPSYRFPTGY